MAIPFLLNDRVGTLSAHNLELVATVLWLNVIVPPAVRLLDLRGRWVVLFFTSKYIYTVRVLCGGTRYVPAL